MNTNKVEFMDAFQLTGRMISRAFDRRVALRYEASRYLLALIILFDAALPVTAQTATSRFKTILDPVEINASPPPRYRSSEIVASTPVVLPRSVQNEVEEATKCFAISIVPASCLYAVADKTGSPFGTLLRALMLLHSDKTLQPYAKDIEWAAESNYPPAMWLMAVMLEKSNPDEALRWLRRSADHGQWAAISAMQNISWRGQSTAAKTMDRAFYQLLSCHPAMSDASTAPTSLNYLYRRMRDTPGLGFADAVRAERELYEYGYAARASEVRAGQGNCETARVLRGGRSDAEVRQAQKELHLRVKETLENIRVSIQRFPELQLFVRAEYLDLLPLE